MLRPKTPPPTPISAPLSPRHFPHFGRVAVVGVRARALLSAARGLDAAGAADVALHLREVERNGRRGHVPFTSFTHLHGAVGQVASVALSVIGVLLSGHHNQDACNARRDPPSAVHRPVDALFAGAGLAVQSARGLERQGGRLPSNCMQNSSL